MRVLVLVTLMMLPATLMRAQQQGQTNPGKPCGEESVNIPAYYYESVLSRIELKAPAGRALIKIAVGADIKLILWTDGEKYQLWTDVPEVSQGNIDAFLDHLDDICQLPPDPWDAAAMIKITWEHKDLSAAQFAKIHRDFTEALSKYVAKIQDRYSPLITTKQSLIYLDAWRHPIVYDNGDSEHIELRVWDVAASDKAPLLAWVRELQKLGADSFHRQFWAKN
jgi:hypothetical protein